MAWNTPGGSKPGGTGGGGNKDPWTRRPGRDGRGSDNGFQDFKRKLDAFLKGKGGSGGGASGDGEGGASSGNESSIVLAVIAIAVMLWGYLSFFQVEAAETAVIQRFGKFVETRGSGWGFRIWPVESVTMVNTKAVNSVKYESRALTSDINLVDLTFTVQYQLRDPVKYLFKVRDAEDGSLQEVSESAIREVVGRSDLESTLVSKRQQLTERAKELIQRTLDKYETGIAITTVNLTDIQVPEAVIPSQRDANKAKADREKAVKEAKAYASGILPVAEGAALRQLQEAEAYKAQVVSIASGEAARFAKIALVYKNAPQVTRQRLYYEAIEGVLGRSNKIILDTRGAGGNMVYLPLDKIMDRTASRTAEAAQGSSAASAAAAKAAESDPSASDARPTDTRQRSER